MQFPPVSNLVTSTFEYLDRYKSANGAEAPAIAAQPVAQREGIGAEPQGAPTDGEPRRVGMALNALA